MPAAKAPQLLDLPAMVGVGDLPLAGQKVAHVADIAAAHGVGLAGQAERAAAGLADLARRQVQIDDRVAGNRCRSRSG